MFSTSFTEHQKISLKKNDRTQVLDRHTIVTGVPFPEPDFKLHKNISQYPDIDKNTGVAGNVIDAKTTQPSSMDYAEEEDVTLTCSHSTIGGNVYIHWCQQNPSQSPQYVIHGLRGTGNSSMASLT
ncbi:hypothetical protein MG293_009312 [Ovis ammon polii]|uniref:Ig-like domain-containing protein n=1 Tax=Ovis ammon polii TaxID=230172 RepID=A0AAD4U8A1_OVIAM|nr:hypothetical protein MG293_009312 [Ovis ammon polii]KAI4567941.1 hypothetical protein MJT46_007739 [Ovis ammon polii x Ovis aries]